LLKKPAITSYCRKFFHHLDDQDGNGPWELVCQNQNKKQHMHRDILGGSLVEVRDFSTALNVLLNSARNAGKVFQE
jgi:hypothetical protein